ncbi:hypothetical protein WT25_05830 [Burkholderia territorii]|uniref:hypothetical protein n=1 Tax=Burkholderia territorii TaxID=1503055 RepID=UPI00076D8C41|nr:hypothetical protein [Burkholderia territorii]KVT88869.1 hypothetical protein WT25_05830 [Burkholderia territorii]
MAEVMIGGAGESPGGTLPSQGALVLGCAAIGCGVFAGYAWLFSVAPVRRIYMRTHKALDGCLAVVFGIAGIRLLASRP